MRFHLLFLFILGVCFLSKAQDTLFDDSNQVIPSKEYRPALGIGLGHYTYYGDVRSRDSRSAYAGAMVYSFYASRRINNSFDLGLRFSTGDMVGGETGPESYFNFKSTLHSGTAYVAYNFGNFFKTNNIVNPYLSLGVSFFEFNNKSDLFDANGNRYYYWSDGIIRNLDENSAQAAQAIQLKRDYVYETDLRSANLDGLERYRQVGFAIPIGLEFEFNVTERFTFRIGSVFHVSFTNMLDNISENGVGVRQGKSGNDHFLQNNLSVHYDLFSKRKKIAPESFVFPDYFALDINDADNDGVINEFDICPFTLKNVAVDKNGCPLDLDLDGVSDFVDAEKNSAPALNVNKNGVTLSDDDYLMWYLTFLDSLDVPKDVLERLASKKVKTAVFRVALKELESGQRISDSLFYVLNAESDLKAFNVTDNKTLFTVGEYGKIEAAEERKYRLIQRGFKNAEVIVLEDNKIVQGDQWEKIAEKQMRERFKEDYAKIDSLDGFYSVKLGSTPAGSTPYEKAKFLKNKEVVPLPGPQNSTDYVIGPFIDTVSAAQNVQEYVAKGFPDAQITKVKDGKVAALTQKMQEEELVQLKSLDRLDDFQKLRTLDGKMVVKIGTITASTSKAESDRLYSDPKAIMVSNPNKTIDFIYPIGYNDELEADIKKQEYLKKGFENPVIASVLFEEDQLKLIYKEILNDKYTISLGAFKASVNNKEEEKILSIPDVRSVQTYDPSIHHYTVGVFETKDETKDRLMELFKQGYKPEVVKFDNGKFIPIDTRGIFNEKEMLAIKDYSANSIVKTNGVVFRVQVGAFKNKVSENQFRNVAVISFLSEGGINKYMSDGASTYKDAYIKKLKLKDLGFKDAFVVAHKDGKKIEVKDLVNSEDFAKIRNELGDQPEENTLSANIEYKVQLGAYKDMMAQDKFSDFKDVQMEIYGDYKRFLTGSFKSYDEASKLKEIAKTKGFPNAFVVAYNKGERMSASEHNPNVIKINEGDKNIASDQPLKKLVFMVQIGMYRGALPTDIATQFEAIPKLIKQITPEGNVRYMAGEFKDPSEATAYKEELTSKGFKGVFLVSFYDSEKIEIKEAVKIFNQSK